MKQRFLEQGINCIRTGLQATEDLDDDTQVLAGAYTPAMGELVDTRRYGRQLLSFLRMPACWTGHHHLLQPARHVPRPGLSQRHRQDGPLEPASSPDLAPDEVPVGHIRVCQGRTSYDLDVNSKTGPTMI